MASLSLSHPSVFPTTPQDILHLQYSGLVTVCVTSCPFFDLFLLFSVLVTAFPRLPLCQGLIHSHEVFFSSTLTFPSTLAELSEHVPSITATKYLMPCSSVTLSFFHWLHRVSVAACRIFNLCWGVRDLSLWLENSKLGCVGDLVP